MSQKRTSLNSGNGRWVKTVAASLGPSGLRVLYPCLIPLTTLTNMRRSTIYGRRLFPRDPQTNGNYSPALYCGLRSRTNSAVLRHMESRCISHTSVQQYLSRSPTRNLGQAGFNGSKIVPRALQADGSHTMPYTVDSVLGQTPPCLDTWSRVVSSILRSSST